MNSKTFHSDSIIPLFVCQEATQRDFEPFQLRGAENFTQREVNC